jgi:hypothetical protein
MNYAIRFILTFILFFFSFFTYAGKISGTVTDDKGVILPFASILIKNSTHGTTANNDGKYFLQLSPGTYTIVCQYVGYERKEKEITIGNDDVVLNFQLSMQQLSLAEVVVRPGGEDPAYEIIRNAIKKRPFYLKQLDTFQCEVYIKGQMQLRDYPNKFMGQKIDFEDGDTSKKKMVYLSESVMKYSSQNDKIKVEVLSTKVSGQKDGFGFSLPQFVTFYKNNVDLGPQLNPRGFISPIADNALNFYKYKFEGSFIEDGREINRIKVIPKRKYEPLFSGYINITDNDWRIHSVELQITKESQMQFLDTLRINQLYVPFEKNVWVIKTQVVYPAIKVFGFDIYGNFVNIYSKFDVHPEFHKKFFDNTVLKYEEGSNKKDSLYWDTVRPVPLQVEEQRDYYKKDSLEKLREDPHYLDSIDRIRNKPSVPGILFLGQTISKQKNRSTLTIFPLAQSVSFNTVEGWVINARVNYTKQLDSTGFNRSISISPLVRYGFSNGHLNAYLTASYDVGKKRPSSFSIGGGKNVYQFNNNNPIDPLFNTFSTLIWMHNYMKIYEAWSGKIDYSKGIADGLTARISFQYQDRIPLENTTDQSWKVWDTRSYTPNYPTDLLSENFKRHQASMLSLGVSWRPGSRYIEFPDRRFEISSKYPTFTAGATMGIKGLFGSDVDYGKWRIGINDELNLKLAGTFKYNISAGGFYKAKEVQVQDYKHFNGNQITMVTNYFNGFLLLPYYKFSNTATLYGEAHIEHHFNGFLTNKIPGFRKLNWQLVGSMNTFYINDHSNYIEAGVGLENVFRILRADFVWGFEYGQKAYTGFRLGVNLLPPPRGN